MTASEYRKLKKRQPGECTWCGGVVTPPRRTFCRPQCVEQFKLGYDWQFAVRQILKRDQYVCQECGFDDKWRRRIFEKLNSPRLRHYLAGLYNAMGFPFEDGREWVEVHHIIPRQRGGSSLPSNLITLCAPCHKEKRKDRQKQ